MSALITLFLPNLQLSAKQSMLCWGICLNRHVMHLEATKLGFIQEWCLAGGLKAVTAKDCFQAVGTAILRHVPDRVKQKIPAKVQ